jgi:hypothetical protein
MCNCGQKHNGGQKKHVKSSSSSSSSSSEVGDCKMPEYKHRLPESKQIQETIIIHKKTKTWFEVEKVKCHEVKCDS